MSIITGEFNFQIEDFDQQKADFYLGKNDGILYVKNCDFFPPPEKDNLNWVPMEYCFRLVKENEHKNGSNTNIFVKNPIEDITTVPIYPIPSTFDDIVPNCKYIDETVDETVDNKSEYQTWLYYSKYAIPNSIESIKIYVEKQQIPNETITSQYAFYIVGEENSSNKNPLKSVTYDPPTILVNKLEIKIKKDDETVTYNGTWEAMRNTFDIVRFSYIDGYDYKYKIRLGTYNNILDNIATIETLLENTSSSTLSGDLDDMLLILENAEATDNNTTPNSIKDIIDYNFAAINVLIDPDITNGINDTLITDITSKITEIKNLITNNVFLYRPDDYVILINSTNAGPPIILSDINARGDITNETVYDTMYDTYAVAPVSCYDIIGPEYVTFKIKYINLNLDIVEKFIESSTPPVGNNSYNIKDKTILNIHGTYTDDNNFVYTRSDTFSGNNDNLHSNIGIYTHYLTQWSSAATLANYTNTFNTFNNIDLSYIKKIYSTDTAFAALRFDGSVIIWGDSTYDTIYINNNSTCSISITNGIGTIPGYTISGIVSTSKVFAAWGTDAATPPVNVILTWGNVKFGTNYNIFPTTNPTNSIKQIHATDYAFVAEMYFDTTNTNVDKLITWGTYYNATAYSYTKISDNTFAYVNNSNESNGTTTHIAITTSTITTTYTISGIATTSNTFAAWGIDGSSNKVIITWGDVQYGTANNIFPATNPTHSIKQIHATKNAFVAELSNTGNTYIETLITWGTYYNATASYTDISDATVYKNDGTDSNNTGTITGFIIEGIANTLNTFAAWGTDTANTPNPVILTWGDVQYGNNVNKFPANPTDTISKIHATDNAFVAELYNTGNTYIETLITWGTYYNATASYTDISDATVYKNDGTDSNNTGTITGFIIEGIANTLNTFAAWGTDNDNTPNPVILTWGDIQFGTGVDKFPAIHTNYVTQIHATDNAFIAEIYDATNQIDEQLISWGNPNNGGTDKTDKLVLSDSTAKEIFSTSNVFMILYRKVILDITFDDETANSPSTGELIVKVTSNVPNVQLTYTLDNTNNLNSSTCELDCTSNNQPPFTVNIPIPQYRTTYAQLIEYKNQAVLQVSKYKIAIDLLYKQFLDFRKCYIKQLLHMEIYTIDDYKGKSGIWYPSYDHSCLIDNYNSSMKKIRYESNINLIHSMISNIRNVYHIGCLQSNLIDKLIAILTVYHTQTSTIPVNNGIVDYQDDPIYLFFQEFIDDIVKEFDSVSQFVIFNNAPIFNKTETDSANLKKLIYRFIDGAQMKYTTTNSNDLVFNLPVLDAEALQLDDIYTGPDEDLYNDFTTKFATIQSKYMNAISLAGSKKSAFAGLQFIIGLRLRIIMDFIEYTKNILD